jgi:2-dehydropantoate 2-reductase
VRSQCSQTFDSGVDALSAARLASRLRFAPRARTLSASLVISRATLARASRARLPALAAARTRASRLRVFAAAGGAMSSRDASPGPSSVLVVGAGRVGTYCACKFADACLGGEVVLKGSPPDRGASSMQPFVDAMCAASGVRHVRTYETVRDRAFDFVFVSVKTYDLPAVKAELDAHGIAPRIAILVHNGIVPPMFPSSVRVVIPQSYDFVETPGEGCGVEIHVKNEEKPWTMPDTPEAREVEAILTRSGIVARADPAFPYGLIRKFFINGVANLLSIVGDCNCDGLLADHRERMNRLYAEFVAVLAEPHADAFAMLPDDFEDVVFRGLASYGEHFPSTKMDFDAGRALEIDSLNGYVCAVAEERGIPAPENRRLVRDVEALVRERDEKTRKKAES